MGKLPQRTWQWVDFSPRLPEYLSKADAGPPQVTSLITADSSGSALPLNSSNKVVSGSRYLETVTSIRCSFTSPNSLKSFLCLHWLLESTRKITSLQLHVTSDVQPRMGQGRALCSRKSMHLSSFCGATHQSQAGRDPVKTIA